MTEPADHPATTSRPAAPRSGSVFDRLVRGLRELWQMLVGRRQLSTESRGERYVHLGLRMAAAGLVLVTVGSLASYFSFEISRAGSAIGTLVLSLLIVAGTALANLTPAARAWHDENADRERPAPKAKSLADWRAAR